MLQARIQCLAGETDQAVKSAESYMRSQQKRVQPLAGYTEILWHAGKKEKAAKSFADLRKVSSSIQFGSPVFDRLKRIAVENGIAEDWRVDRKPADDVGDRPELDTLGPFRWQPIPAPDWVLNDVSGKPYALKQFQGKPTVVIFYLGYDCLHCAEQLQAFAPMADKFREAGIELIAISTDAQQDLQQSLDNYKEGIPFPLVSNAELDIFKKYRAYDDFEDTPLHGTFLIDGEGLVR
ncbi:MAG: peroxiredoxin family protein [Planctomycetes bacterium]|nr:peroxiredoxin family protein [Planctomycetota bacterium]